MLSSLLSILFLILNVINIGGGQASFYGDQISGNETYDFENIGNGQASVFNGLSFSGYSNSTYNSENIGTGTSSVYSGLDETESQNKSINYLTSESDYSNYNTILLNYTTPNNEDGMNNVLISNDGNVITAGLSFNQVITSKGTTVYTGISSDAIGQVGRPALGLGEIVQSITGKYEAIINYEGKGSVSVFKDGTFLQNLGINTSQFFSGILQDTIVRIAISPDGHYIAVVGGNATNHEGTKVLIFQGS